jgi:hypothetical protein
VTEHRARLDLAFSVEEDSWNGERYVQLTVADFRASVAAEARAPGDGPTDMDVRAVPSGPA